MAPPGPGARAYNGLDNAAQLGWRPGKPGMPSTTLPFGDIAHALSLIGHHDALLRGVFSSADLLYFLIFTLCFLALTVVRLDMDRH